MNKDQVLERNGMWVGTWTLAFFTNVNPNPLKIPQVLYLIWTKYRDIS